MMRLLNRQRLVAVALALSAPMPLMAHEYKAGDIKIVHPWMRQPPAAAKVGGGFMTLTNTGTVADRLIGGTIESAARLEVHEMKMVDGVMRMRQLPSGLEIKPGETVVLKPGSYHLMFMELSAAPGTDKRLKGTLVFEKSGTVEVEYKIEPAGAAISGGADHPSIGHGSAAGTSGHGSGSGAMKNGSH